MRPHLTRHLRAAALVLAVTLASAACADDAGPGSSPGADPGNGIDQPGDPEVGPLDDYLGVGTRSIETDDALNLRIEEELARCMAAEGFEYVPYVDAGFDATVTADGRVMLEPAGFPDLPADEFAAQFGYGISTKELGAEQSRAQKNPNDAIVARMSVAERVAYHQTFYGPQIALDDEGYLAGTSISNADTSCSGRAYALEPTDRELARTERRIGQVEESFASLLERVRDLRDQLERDPRVAAATSAWAACLADAGHAGYTALDEPQAKLRARAERLLGPDLATEGVAAAQLADLRAAEIELAVADQRCRRPWRTSHDAVKVDLEKRFVRENLAELEAFRSAMSAAVSDGR
ncbi:hypothetical protein [Nocardioides daejeonensis]|uniref:hypothetical protein n=1 Tax=Nocardioides daejeonensis TaxID=1046556 RepID=UPI000D74CC68|nr:hypothetical protein [Nocardioides daejeonensis]